MKQTYRHGFQFDASGNLEINENLETFSRYYTSSSEAAWALDRELCHCKNISEEYFIDGNQLHIRDGAIDIPHFLEPPFQIEMLDKSMIRIRGAMNFAGYSENLRKSIVKLNGMVTSGDGLDIDVILVPERTK
jgi:hypothetical protein